MRWKNITGAFYTLNPCTPVKPPYYTLFLLSNGWVLAMLSEPCTLSGPFTLPPSSRGEYFGSASNAKSYSGGGASFSFRIVFFLCMYNKTSTATRSGMPMLIPIIAALGKGFFGWTFFPAQLNLSSGIECWVRSHIAMAGAQSRISSL